MKTFEKGRQYLCSKDIIIGKHLWFKGGNVYTSSKDDYLIGCDHCEHSADILCINGVLQYFASTGKTVETDKVNHPSHYTHLKDKCGIEVIDITRHLDFDLGNAVKYLLRAGYKTEQGYNNKDKTIEDLKKAIWYINDKIKMLEENKEN